MPHLLPYSLFRFDALWLVKATLPSSRAMQQSSEELVVS